VRDPAFYSHAKRDFSKELIWGAYQTTFNQFWMPDDSEKVVYFHMTTDERETAAACDSCEHDCKTVKYHCLNCRDTTLCSKCAMAREASDRMREHEWGHLLVRAFDFQNVFLTEATDS